MSTSRKGRGFRVVPSGATTGRKGRSGPVPAGRARVSQSDALERLFEATALRYLALAFERAGETVRPSSAALEDRAKRAREALRLMPGGAAMCIDATRALGATESFLADVARQALARRTLEDSQRVAARFAVLAASIIREENPRSTIELTGAIMLAAWQAQAERDLAALHATPRDFSAKATTKGMVADGGTLTKEVAVSYAERHARAGVASTHARQERVAFVDTLIRREKGRQSGHVNEQSDPAVHAIVETIAADRAARAVEADAWEAEHASDGDQVHGEEPLEEQRAEREEPALPPAHIPPSIDALNRAPRPGQFAHRPTPQANVEPARVPVAEWLPECLRPWSAKFANLEHLPLIQRVHQACAVAGALQINGAFGRSEAEIVSSFQKWRAYTIATGRLPEGDSDDGR